jgi:3-hydroxy-D-aspartate aldolase
MLVWLIPSGYPTMPLIAPASLGAPLGEIDTPALIVDLDAFEHNLAAMKTALRGAGVRLRAHAKAHKCPEIARLQIKSGAVGICVQKVSEAEVMVEAGLRDIFVSNQVVGAQKVKRLVQLGRRARIAACVDDARNVAELSAAADGAGVVIDVLVEVNVGQDRCGVAPGDPALHLVQAVKSARFLRFAGLHAYHGSAQHMRSVTERRVAIEQAAAKARRTKELLASYHIGCETITGGGTGTFLFEAASDVFNEVQAGSYIFMDADYGRNAWDGFPAFRQSLFVLSTVMSTAVPGKVVVDAGLKALATDSGMPLVHRRNSLEYLSASDEHGVINVADAREAPKLGEKLRLVPGHCDPTVNLHDWIVGVRDDKVEALWPVAARGAVF